MQVLRPQTNTLAHFGYPLQNVFGSDRSTQSFIAVPLQTKSYMFFGTWYHSPACMHSLHFSFIYQRFFVWGKNRQYCQVIKKLGMKSAQPKMSTLQTHIHTRARSKPANRLVQRPRNMPGPVDLLVGACVLARELHAYDLIRCRFDTHTQSIIPNGLCGARVCTTRTCPTCTCDP